MDPQEAQHLSDPHTPVRPVSKKMVGVFRLFLTQKNLLTVIARIELIYQV